jgi:hypothetical protein
MNIYKGQGFQDFSKWLYKKHKIYFDDLEKMDFKEKPFLKALLFDWMDENEIYISIIPIIYQNGKINCFQIEINNRIIGQKTKHSRNFETRDEAIIRAFEVSFKFYDDGSLF